VGVGGWIGPGVEEPGGNSNGGSGGKVEAVVEGEPATRLPPPTTVPGSAEWVGISMSAATAARPAAARTRMISLALRILPLTDLLLSFAETAGRPGSAEWAVIRPVLAGRGRLLESLDRVFVHLQYAQA
jgi:hypothetical protein